MLRKLIQIIKKKGSIISKDLGMALAIVACFIGTVLYLYNYHKDRESYALNIVLTALVSRITGQELMESIRFRLYMLKYYLKAVIYKKEFIDADRSSLRVASENSPLTNREGDDSDVQDSKIPNHHMNSINTASSANLKLATINSTSFKDEMIKFKRFKSESVSCFNHKNNV